MLHALVRLWLALVLASLSRHCIQTADPPCALRTDKMVHMPNCTTSIAVELMRQAQFAGTPDHAACHTESKNAKKSDVSPDQFSYRPRNRRQTP